MATTDTDSREEPTLYCAPAPVAVPSNLRATQKVDLKETLADHRDVSVRSAEGGRKPEGALSKTVVGDPLMFPKLEVALDIELEATHGRPLESPQRRRESGRPKGGFDGKATQMFAPQQPEWSAPTELAEGPGPRDRTMVLSNAFLARSPLAPPQAAPSMQPMQPVLGIPRQRGGGATTGPHPQALSPMHGPMHAPMHGSMQGHLHAPYGIAGDAFASGPYPAPPPPDTVRPVSFGQSMPPSGSIPTVQRRGGAPFAVAAIAGTTIGLLALVVAIRYMNVTTPYAQAAAPAAATTHIAEPTPSTGTTPGTGTTNPAPPTDDGRLPLPPPTGQGTASHVPTAHPASSTAPTRRRAPNAANTASATATSANAAPSSAAAAPSAVPAAAPAPPPPPPENVHDALDALGEEQLRRSGG